MTDNEEMIRKIDGNLFEVFWDTYGNKVGLNKAFIKDVFLAVDIKYKNWIKAQIKINSGHDLCPLFNIMRFSER